MILSWRIRRAGRRGNKNNELSGHNLDMEIMIPTHFRCPISLDLMKDPVTLSTGITYDRESIEKWIEAGNQTCPVTKQVLSSFDQIPNHAIRKVIQDWCVQNRSHGIERIPTPRIPVTPYEVSEICSRIMGATQRGDRKKCQELVVKINNWGKESERNKRCFVESGAGCVLAASFESFASISMEKHVDLLEEILAIFTWMFPLGEEGQSKLGSGVSLRCIAWFLKSGDLSARQSAVLVLKELLSLDQRHLKAVAEIEDIVEALVMLIREPICPRATKASLMALYYMISPSVTSGKIVAKLVELGLVLLLLEILFDDEKDICEKAMGVLDGICDCKEGRDVTYKNALIVPILVKKILPVPDLTTKFSVSILWKLCKNDKSDDGGVVVEALQEGAFRKLLVLLQVNCGDGTKGRVTELLKSLNHYRGKIDCIDLSMDLKRAF